LKDTVVALNQRNQELEEQLQMSEEIGSERARENLQKE